MLTDDGISKFWAVFRRDGTIYRISRYGDRNVARCRCGTVTLSTVTLHGYLLPAMLKIVLFLCCSHHPLHASQAPLKINPVQKFQLNVPIRKHVMQTYDERQHLMVKSLLTSAFGSAVPHELLAEVFLP